MGSLESLSFYRDLRNSGVVNFQLTGHGILSLFYLFCAITFTALWKMVPLYLEFYQVLLVLGFYILVIAALLSGFARIHNFENHAKGISMLGITLAMFHQIYVINYWDPQLIIGLVVLYLVLVLDVALGINLLFNRKMKLLLKYISIKAKSG